MRLRPLAASSLVLIPALLLAEEQVDLQAVSRIREEGFRRSKVMQTAAYLCDVIGPRVTGSPAAKRASEWARKELESLGLENARLESWGPFGVGWSLERVSVHMLSPTLTPLYALPRAWSPGTNGVVRAKAVRAKLESEKDFAEYKGKLKGKLVLLSEPKPIEDEEKAPLVRFDAESLAELGRFEIPSQERLEEARAKERSRHSFVRALRTFLAEEGAAAAFSSSRFPGLIVAGGTSGFRKGAERGVPAFVLMPEQYNRLVRLVERGLDVELELELRVSFDERELSSQNTLAELPGTDKKEELVMAGAHIDSWHAGTGASDNAAGVAVVLEAARILKALGLTPRRTIRFAFWTGEEQTLGGSTAYVSTHFAERPLKDEGEQELTLSHQTPLGPLTFKPDYAKLAAYFNLDNGTGRVRGVYLQENAALRPIFEAWIEPLQDLGVTQLTMRKTDDTDIDPFDAVGLPGLQFIQDDVEYESRTWHTQLDVYDRLKREDLMQASVVMATFLYNAAMRDEPLPRRPLFGK